MNTVASNAVTHPSHYFTHALCIYSFHPLFRLLESGYSRNQINDHLQRLKEERRSYGRSSLTLPIKLLGKARRSLLGSRNSSSQSYWSTNDSIILRSPTNTRKGGHTFSTIQFCYALHHLPRSPPQLCIQIPSHFCFMMMVKKLFMFFLCGHRQTQYYTMITGAAIIRVRTKIIYEYTSLLDYTVLC